MSGGNIFKNIIRKSYDKSFYLNLRRKKDRLVQKCCSPLFRIGVSADVITSTGLITGIISITFLNSSHFLFLSFWGLTRLIDLVDGSIYRFNRKRWFRKLNLDKYSDITYDTLLTCAAIPYTGFLLAFSSIIARFIHVKLEKKNWGNNFLSPHGGFEQFFFAFRMFREGLLVQTIYSLSTPLVKKLFLRHSERT